MPFEDKYWDVFDFGIKQPLQHVWAVKSHDLLYKPSGGWEIRDRGIIEEMRQLSNSLRAADSFLLILPSTITYWPVP